MKAGRGLVRDGNTMKINFDSGSIGITKDHKIRVSRSYPGQSSIVKVGVIQSGDWRGKKIGVGYGGTGV